MKKIENIKDEKRGMQKNPQEVFLDLNLFEKNNKNCRNLAIERFVMNDITNGLTPTWASATQIAWISIENSFFSH